jgi:hypothetical protein
MLKCTSVIPQLEKLSYIFTKLTEYHQGTPFKFNDKYLWVKVSSKVKFIKLLEALGAKKELLKEFNKVSVQELRRVIDESTKDEESITVTRQSKVHEQIVGIDWCGHNEAICQMERSGNSVEYTVILEDWVKTRDRLIEQGEEPFKKANINIVEGGVSIAGRY